MHLLYESKLLLLSKKTSLLYIIYDYIIYLYLIFNYILYTYIFTY
jgi:hypothetical protein